MDKKKKSKLPLDKPRLVTDLLRDIEGYPSSFDGASGYSGYSSSSGSIPESFDNLFKRLDERSSLEELYVRIKWFLRENFWELMFIRRIKWFIQRGKRGYSDSDLWSFDNYLCRVIGNGLEELRKNATGFPIGLTEKKWDNVLKQISYGFLNRIRLQEEEDYFDETTKDYIKRWKQVERELNKSLKLFSKYFGSLWD